MATASLARGQARLAWETEPSAFAEGVTLSHRLHYGRTCRVEAYTGTSIALINAGVCNEGQLPPEHSVMRTFTPDGKRKKTGHPMESGTLQIVRAGRRLLRCDRFIALTIQEQNYINAEKERDNQEYLQREQERKEREHSQAESKNWRREERLRGNYSVATILQIEASVQEALDEYLLRTRIANEINPNRRTAIATPDNVVIYPKVWRNA
jgi:hypothetical protein